MSQKSILAQDASKTSKKSKMSKKIEKVAPMCRGKNAVHHLRGSILENAQKKNSRVAIRAPTPTRENPPKGSKIQPRSDGHRSTPVPLPSKQEEVKPNRHLGEMSAVNKVPEKQREGIRPENDEGNSAHAPKCLRNPTMSNKTTTTETCT
jgi:hypothetical protein